LTLATPKGPQRRERIAGGLSLIRFTVWSSVVHGAIMAVQAATDHGQMGHLMGEVPALFLAQVTRWKSHSVRNSATQ